MFEKKKTAYNKKEGMPSGAQVMASILPEVSKSLGLEEKVRELALFRLWKDVVDTPYRERSQPIRILRRQQKTVLQVAVTDGVIASELAFQVHGYVAALNRYASQTGIHLDVIDVTVKSRPG